MFTIKLKDATGNEITRVEAQHNDRYLMSESGEFPILSELSDSSYDVFGSDQMTSLIKDLKRLTECAVLHEEERAHIGEIVALAEICSSTPGSTLTFTPFTRPAPLEDREEA